MLPNKRSMVAAFMAAGSCVPVALRYLVGSYLPSFQALISSPVCSFEYASHGSLRHPVTLAELHTCRTH